MAVAAGRRPMEGREVQCVACMLVDSRLTVAAVGSLLQGSPTLRTLARETYRHSLAVTGGLGGWQPAVTAACRNCRRLPLPLPLSTAAAAGARRREFGVGHACCLTVPACLPGPPGPPALLACSNAAWQGWQPLPVHLEHELPRGGMDRPAACLCSGRCLIQARGACPPLLATCGLIHCMRLRRWCLQSFCPPAPPLLPHALL